MPLINGGDLGGRDGEATIIYTGVAAILFNQYPEVSLKRPVGSGRVQMQVQPETCFPQGLSLQKDPSSISINT